jgi:hypothetical protein
MHLRHVKSASTAFDNVINGEGIKKEIDKEIITSVIKEAKETKHEKVDRISRADGYPGVDQNYSK